MLHCVFLISLMHTFGTDNHWFVHYCWQWVKCTKVTVQLSNFTSPYSNYCFMASSIVIVCMSLTSTSCTINPSILCFQWMHRRNMIGFLVTVAHIFVQTFLSSLIWEFEIHSISHINTWKLCRGSFWSVLKLNQKCLSQFLLQYGKQDHQFPS